MWVWVYGWRIAYHIFWQQDSIFYEEANGAFLSHVFKSGDDVFFFIENLLLELDPRPSAANKESLYNREQSLVQQDQQLPKKCENCGEQPCTGKLKPATAVSIDFKNKRN